MTDSQPAIFVGGPMHGIQRVLEPSIGRWEVVARSGGASDNPFDEKIVEHVYRKSDATLLGAQIWYDSTVPIAKLLDDVVGIVCLHVMGDAK